MVLPESNFGFDDDIQVLTSLAQNRAGTYSLLSRVWGAEMDENLWRELGKMVLPQLPDLPELNQAYRDLEKAIRETPPVSLQELAVDYARLCLGSDPRQGADPYESVHRNQEGLLMQDEWESVLRFYAEMGMMRAEGTVETEDHLALELEFMAQTCDRLVSALAEKAFPEASWLTEQQTRFLDQHLLKWLPSFVKRVHKLGKTSFYKAFADLSLAFLKMDRKLLE